jgi:hypothetical protein
VLPHPARGPAPPVVFRDAAGQPLPGAEPEDDDEGFTIELAAAPEFDRAAWEASERASERRVLESARVPLLWPAHAAGPPVLRGWGDGDITLERDELRVTLAATDVATDLEGLLEDRVRMRLGDARRAARAALESVRSELPGRVDGRAVTFAALAGGGAWAALRGTTIAVSGDGPLPEHLELVRLGVDDVQSRFDTR